MPLFILSKRDRDRLSALAAEAGWRAVAARRTAGVEQRYLSSQALVAVVDACATPLVEAVAMVGILAEAVEASGGALLVLIDTNMPDMADALLAAGATHYLMAPVTAKTLSAALHTAQIMVERLGGGVQQVHSRHAIERSDALTWRHDRISDSVHLSDALAQRLGLKPAQEHAAGRLLAMFPRSDRAAIMSAFRQLQHSHGTTALAHALPGFPEQRVAHHIYANPDGLAGEIEILSTSGQRAPEARDYLTGLSNRAAAIVWIEERLGAGHGVMLLLLSISQFDRMNAAYGQMAGDALLGRVARRIERLVEQVIGSGVMLSRIAGTEFLVGLDTAALEHDGTDRAVFLARRLIGAIGQPFSAGDHLIRLTGRCGIADAIPGDDSTRLLRRAGAALADAKQSDGEGIRIRTPDEKSRDVDHDRLETDLRLALDRNEIDIAFQPQYAMLDDCIVGVEALARWNHPHYGALGAGVLFSAAERSDYLLPLSAHIQQRALTIAANWPEALSSVRLAVNVTAADISQPDFLDSFLHLVEESGFPRDRLTVEITESGLIEDVEAAAVLLDALRSAGLTVAIDDFGTGYSSLAYLKSLPLDYLKIDSGLAKDIAGSPRDRIIVRAVIEMAKSLGLKVIAEGVETETQLALLAREGCDFYQGFLRSAAVSSEELELLCKDRLSQG